MSTKPLTPPILVIMQGGLVQDVVNIPPGLTVQVIDYDTEGEEDERLEISPLDGHLCCLSTFPAG